MFLPVVDLHSDLLSYLVHKEGRSPGDAASRNSFPQMQEGKVAIQTLAIFARTKESSVADGRRQIDQFLQLLSKYPSQCAPLSAHRSLTPDCVQFIAAIENASAVASELEPLEAVFERLEKLLKTLPLFYITMTWDGENRFGGGTGSSAGLKQDGKNLLAFLSNKRVAIDLSHTSDRLAYDIFETIDKMSLQIPILASHSNFRSVTNRPRNLPDDIAKEIIRRNGIIGMNFFAPFIHTTDPSVLLRHIEYGLALGGEKALCFGADFFSDQDFPVIKHKYPEASCFFFEDYKDSSTYPYILDLLHKRLKFSLEVLSQIAYTNGLNFLKANIL